MKFFQQDTGTRSPRHRKVYAIYELAYTTVDFLAAVLFIVGSIMFFRDDLQTIGTWFFLVGSIFFAAKPMLRVVREFHLLAIGDFDDLAERMEI